MTLPLIGAMRHASDAETQLIRRLFTRVDPSDEEILQAVQIVEERGGLDYAQRRALDYAELAEACLEGLGESPALEALRSSVSYAVARSR